MNKEEINNLILEVQDGSEDAFTKLYSETYKGVFSFIYSYISNYQQSEDLLQDTFIKVRRNIQSYKGGNGSAWILEIVKNLCIDYIRKEKRHPEEELEENSKVGSVEDSHTTKLVIHDYINKYLEEDERQIVILHIVNGYKNREIAKLLGLPLGTVLWKYNKAIKILKKKLEEVDNENK